MSAIKVNKYKRPNICNTQYTLRKNMISIFILTRLILFLYRTNNSCSRFVHISKNKFNVHSFIKYRVVHVLTSPSHIL